MTPADIAMITRVLGLVVREFTAKSVSEALTPLLERNAALELRIMELETNPAPIAVGPAGPIGQKGDTGSGIASLVVSAEGRLLAHLTDGRSVDAGPVPHGKDGASVTVGDVAPIVSAEFERIFKEQIVPRLVIEARTCVEAIPRPKDGVTGPRGERGQDAPAPDLDAIVTRVLALVPAPARGATGATGERGPQGESIAGPVGPAGPAGLDGKSIDMEMVAARIASAVAAIPVPKDGAPGADGRSVTLEDVTPFITRELDQRVAALPIAKDGIGFTGAVITREGHLVLTLSNGERQDVGLVIGKDGTPGLDGTDAIGTPGKDGQDGLGFDDYDLYLNETLGWIFSLGQGERRKEWVLGIPFDSKVYEAGKVYPKGAGTTWDGHYWIALAQTSEAPGEGCPSWRLAVRRGKQGREGKQGKDGSAGRDLTQIDPATGRKW